MGHREKVPVLLKSGAVAFDRGVATDDFVVMGEVPVWCLFPYHLEPAIMRLANSQKMATSGWNGLRHVSRKWCQAWRC